MKLGQAQNRQKEGSRKKEYISIGKNSLIYAGGRALSQAVGFFMIPIYTRFIAPSGYGSLEMIEIITAVIAMVISLGSADGMSRFYYAQKRQVDRDEVVSTIIIGLGLGAIPIVCFFVGISGYITKIVLDVPDYKFFFQLAIITVWFGLLCELGHTYLRMIYKAKMFIFVTTVQLILALSLNIWFVVYEKLEILGIFYSGLITQGSVGVILSMAILKKTGFKLNFKILYELIRFGLPLVPSRIGLMVGFMSNRFFLRWLGAADPNLALAQIGLFSLGHKFGVVVNRFVSAPLNSYWGPRRLEMLLAEDVQNTKETIAHVCTYAIFCSVYAALLLSVGIKDVIQIIAEPSYHGAYVVVPFVALSYVALALENHFNIGIIFKKRTKWSSYITLISLVVVLGWNYFFIPKWGIIGAATSNLAGFAVRLVLVYYVSQRLYEIPFELRRLLILIMMACTIFFICQFVNIVNPYVALPIHLAIASLLPLYLFFLNFYTRDEMNFTKQFVTSSLHGRTR